MSGFRQEQSVAALHTCQGSKYCTQTTRI